MQLKPKSPALALKPMYRKDNIKKADFERFTAALRQLFVQMEGGLEKAESEKYFESLLNGFLNDAFYKDRNEINTKTLHGNSAIDTAIYIGKKVGVLIEVKEPTKKNEMITDKNLYKKSFYEAVMYYLYEKIITENNEIKHIIITNLDEWFVFDATEFNRLFYQDTDLRNVFKKWKNKELDNSTTQQMYDIIAKCVQANDQEIIGTFIELNKYKKHLKDDSENAQKKLTALFKILSPRHLLKEQTANDSNSLNTDFYHELLHIIGLEDVKDKKGSKRIIQRKEDREFASLLENTIEKIRTRGVLRKLDGVEQYGNTEEEQIFSIALELCLTWINRILFLKLLESQLLTYHKGKSEYKFLSPDKLQEFDNLETLFFEVLAIETQERSDYAKSRFPNVPYLNSSLFEPTELEDKAAFISSLKDNLELSIHRKTVLKTDQKRSTGKLSTLQYLLQFLDAYDFGVEGNEEIQEDAKTLINASVLGLIFEKINGYKEGSFYTPGFITMYMCRETIRRAVVEKINNQLNWTCKTFDDVFNKIDSDNRLIINEIINSLTICDPAVGSGHFLVSALNEIIAIKSDLKILMDKNGKRIRDYDIEIDNDELNIIDEDGNPFQYTVNENANINKEKQRIQETLFNEKRNIIENCLFGVDINPNSVKICRLRLWIELLKHAYYTQDSQYRELETLPNIDINIKQGNSLISRFALDENLSDVFKKQKYNLEAYKIAVATYRSTRDKATKNQLKNFLDEIKEQFQTNLASRDPLRKKMSKVRGEILLIENPSDLFGNTKIDKKELAKKKQELKKLETQRADIESSKIYNNAFEWRFEFPEVLDADGVYVGFDCVIGNPPYISLSKIKNSVNLYSMARYSTYVKGTDIYCLFYEKGGQIINSSGHLTYITSNSWLNSIYGNSLKEYFREELQPIKLLNIEDVQIFEEATVESNILTLKKGFQNQSFNVCNLRDDYFFGESIEEYFNNNQFNFEFPKSSQWIIKNKSALLLKSKIEVNTVLIKDINVTINFGIKTGYNAGFIINEETKDKLINSDGTNSEIIKPILRGRDISRYSYTFSNVWVIGTFPSLSLQIEKFPSLKNYFLDVGKKRLEQSGKKGSRKKTSNKWFETQDSISYWQDFKKPKIVWGEISDSPKFTYDEKGFYAEATTFLMTGEKLKFLLGILNSKLSEWYFGIIATTTGMGTTRWKKYKLQQLPIKRASEKQENNLTLLVDEILEIKQSDPSADTSGLEKEIDKLVYTLYDLTAEEIGIIEAAVQ